MKAYSNQTLREYYVHFETRNLSFLKMAALLDAAGVENNLFFLQLNNKALRNIDPYDPNLSDKEKFMIFKECSENRWYFYREVFRVSEAGTSTESGGGTMFKLNRGNLAYLWATELNLSTYLIMPRQTGKTWAAIADCTWTHQFVRGSSILHFNKNQSDANSNLRRISEAVRLLPTWMQHSSYDNLDPSDKRRVKNNEKLIRNTIDASIEAMASAGNESKADAMARGRTASKIWWDELAYIFFNDAMYGASTPAYEKAREIAENNGIPYAITITTTPGDLATPHGAFAYRMMNDSIRFSEDMYDWKLKKLLDVIKHTPDKMDFLFIQFNHLQLGETDEWYLERAKKMNNPLKARREYLLEWINTNGNSPFDPDDVDMIGELARQKEPTAKTYKVNKYFNLTVYSEYHGKKPVLIGVDVSGGLGRDSTAVVVVNPETLVPMAFFKSNMIPSDQLRKLLMTIVRKRYPHCVLTIENNSVGKPLIDELRDTSLSRVLYKERKKRQIDQGPHSFTKKKTRELVEYGHNTNPTTRSQMMEMLESIVHNSNSHVAFPELYEEIRHLELKNGRIDHGSATHDDCVMAYLGVLWIVRYGVGLKGKGIYYCIQEGLDDDENRLDTTDIEQFANNILLKKKPLNDAEEERFLSYMRRDQPVEDSSTWAERERAEMYRAMDQRDGLMDDDEDADINSVIDSIPESTSRLLLKNYYSLIGDNGNDIMVDLLHPEYADSDDDWSSLYRM